MMLSECLLMSVGACRGLSWRLSLRHSAPRGAGVERGQRHTCCVIMGSIQQLANAYAILASLGMT